MASDSYGFLRGKWAKVATQFASGSSEIHMRVEDETDDTLCGMNQKGARVVIAKRCIEAAFESGKGTTEIRTERGIDRAANKLRERRKQPNK